MKDSFTIGELATLFDLNVQTLHYYESIGLFSPERRREGSGERIYRFDQIYSLATIRFLKRLGYPLARIRENMDSRDPEFTLSRMREQSGELSRRAAELSRIRDAIDRKIRFVEERSAGLDPGAIAVRRFPRRRYLAIGMEESLYRSDDFYFYTTVVFYNGDLKQFGALVPEGMERIEGIDEALHRSIPEGEYLVGCHVGPYERIGESFARIRAEAGRRGIGLASPDETIDINIIDQFVERDSARYVTEVQFALAR